MKEMREKVFIMVRDVREEKVKQRHWTDSWLFLFYGQVIAVLTAYYKTNKGIVVLFHKRADEDYKKG